MTGRLSWPARSIRVQETVRWDMSMSLNSQYDTYGDMNGGLSTGVEGYIFSDTAGDAP